MSGPDEVLCVRVCPGTFCNDTEIMLISHLQGVREDSSGLFKSVFKESQFSKLSLSGPGSGEIDVMVNICS